METYLNTLSIKTSNDSPISAQEQQNLEQVRLYLNNIQDFDQYISDHESEIPINSPEDQDIANEIKFTSTPPVNESLNSGIWKDKLKVSWISEHILNCSLWFVIMLSKQFPELVFEYPILAGNDQLIVMTIQDGVKYHDDKLIHSNVLIVDRLVRCHHILDMEKGYRQKYYNDEVEVQLQDIRIVEKTEDVIVSGLDYSIAFPCDHSPIYTIRKYEHMNGTLLKFEWYDYTDSDQNMFPDENDHFRCMLEKIGVPDAPIWHEEVRGLLTETEGNFQFYPEAS
jgi:hypothetical protein